MSQNAKSFLSNLINDFGFDLQVSAEWSDEKGCILNLTGDDVSLVLRENGEMLASRNKNGDHRYTKMSETWVFFPKLMMFPSNGSFHSAFAPQVKKYIQSCCWEVQAHQDQLRFQKRTSPR